MTADTALASMTGYGSASAESGRYRVTVRVRSVNHRNLNLAVKIPESYRHAEQALRGLLKERLTRGHVDLTVELECLLSPTTSVALVASHPGLPLGAGGATAVSTRGVLEPHP